ncbi:MAG: hypothetical protein ABJ056_08520 [Halioglobus sp.]
MQVNRIYELAGLAGLACSVLVFYASLSTAGHRVNIWTTPQINTVTEGIIEAGLKHRDDVNIEIGGQEVALGFSRQGCDGLLLIASLPNTAQGWSHIAPRMDMTAFNVQYLYDSTLHAQVPRLQRLTDKLLSELRPGFELTPPRLMAIAEAGHCGLLQSTIYVLETFTQPQRVSGLHQTI